VTVKATDESGQREPLPILDWRPVPQPVMAALSTIWEAGKRSGN
jgi:hypothetical protein